MSSPCHRIPTLDARVTRPEQIMRPRAAMAPRSLRRQQVDTDIARMTGFTPEPDLFNILILNYTMKCPLACDYCCYGCSPKRSETMDEALALDLVDQAAELGIFAQCGFTGGEALIFHDEIMRITARMQKHGLPFSMISSCYWAKDMAEARRVLHDLAAHGIDVFTATHDPSHQNWVPLQYVRNAIDAARECGVRVCLCSSFYDDTMRLEQIFPEYVGQPDIDIVNRVVLPDVGRMGQRNISVTPASYGHVPQSPGFGSCYKRIYHDITVFWDGEVYPCCSVYNREMPKLSLGNVYRDTLSEVWDRAEGSLLLRVMKSQNFAELYRLLREADADLARDLPDPSQAVGPCHLCHRLFRDPVLADRILAVMERLECERITQLLAAVRAQKGDAAGERVILDTLRSVSIA